MRFISSTILAHLCLSPGEIRTLKKVGQQRRQLLVTQIFLKLGHRYFKMSSSNQAPKTSAAADADAENVKKVADQNKPPVSAANATAGQPAMDQNCIFCKISQKKMENQAYLHYDDHLYVIPDISPHAPHHYLVVSRDHLPNTNALTNQNLPLVKKMQETAMTVLGQKLGGDIQASELRLGFHIPPLVTVGHLHMHILYPLSEMSWFYRYLIFNKSLLFITPEDLIKRLITSTIT